MMLMILQLWNEGMKAVIASHIYVVVS